MSLSDEITLLAVGDIMLGDSPYCFGHGVGSQIDRHGPLFPWEHVHQTLKDADITFGNLEIIISKHNRKTDPFPALEYRAQPSAMEGLIQSGFDIFNIASNHTMEHGKEALEENLDLLAKQDMLTIGVDLPEKNISRISSLECNGKKFCFLGYNFRPQQYFIAPPAWPTPDLELIKKDIDSIRDKADCIIVSLHWGDEFITYPSPAQVDIAHSLIDYGVNIILGHHTHIVQGVEKYNGGIIAYSLGNFIFDLWQERLCKSMILKCIIKNNGEIDFDIIPVIINRKYQPVIQSGEVGDKIRNELLGLAAKIGKFDDAHYKTELGMNFKRFRSEIYKYYLLNLWRYNPKHLIANFRGALGKRV